MKKCFAVILALLYLSTSMGANLHLHYCMEKGHPQEVKTGCCKDKTDVLKAEHYGQHVYSSSWVSLLFAGADAASSSGLHVPGMCTILAGHVSLSHDHFPGKVPLFMRNCNLRL